MTEHLKQVTHQLYRYTVDRMSNGEIPTFLGIDGLLALMYDNIRRKRATGSTDEILELACNALVALQLVIPEIVEEPPPTLDEQLVQDSSEEIMQHLPPEFRDWQTDPEQAKALLMELDVQKLSVAKGWSDKIKEAAGV